MNKKLIKLDHLGQFFMAVASEKNPGTFSVTAHLNEDLHPKALQRAVGNIIKRLPHINARLHRGFLHYYHLLLKNPPKIRHESEFPAVCRHFQRGERLIRVIYGKRHFTVEVRHSVCDGRSLATVVRAILVDYFRLLGAQVSPILGKPCKQETENAYAAHADLREYWSDKAPAAYVPPYTRTTPRIFTQKIELAGLKTSAKARGMTVSEYILSCIMEEFEAQSVRENGKCAITASVPIDCRGFIPTNCLRNFVTHKTIVMPNKKSISQQFAEIDYDYIQNKISEPENFINLGKYVPLFMKNWLIKLIGKSLGSGFTTGFSNIGVLQLPEEVQDRVEMISFALGPEPKTPYVFACATLGNTLAFTATTTARDTSIIVKISNRLSDECG